MRENGPERGSRHSKNGMGKRVSASMIPGRDAQPMSTGARPRWRYRMVEMEHYFVFTTPMGDADEHQPHLSHRGGWPQNGP